jgi:CRP-like cAMP-binding protein
MPDTNSLRQITLFASLSEETLARVGKYAIERNYDAGEIILLEGDPGRAAYFIFHGQVQVFRVSINGREQVLANLGTGDSFNAVPILETESLNRASARALTSARLYLLRKEDFLRLLQTCPDLALALLQDFASRLSHLTGLVEQLSLHSIRGRLARFLIDQADQGASPGQWTQDEIAAQLGTVRDVVGRTLRAFEDDGLIRRQRNRILLLDRAGLESESER